MVYHGYPTCHLYFLVIHTKYNSIYCHTIQYPMAEPAEKEGEGRVKIGSFFLENKRESEVKVGLFLLHEGEKI